ncbi:MAG: hypothetical protein COA97_06520 [Flavobacteriales bacterium]|nr:MAG: hypothetical protein COA97_06520 [Flavobacteriales bacterium]
MRYLIVFILLGSFVVTVGQQAPLSSQYMMNRLSINPAYAGELGFNSVSISYRKQWVGMEGAPTTQNISIHGPVSKGKIGLGIMVFRDVIGVSRENNISAFFAYKIQKKKDEVLSFGIAASAVFSNNQWSQIITSDPNDEAFSNNSPQYIFPDFSAGFYYKNNNYNIGFSIPNFLQHKLDASSSGYSIINDFSQYNYLLETGLIIKSNHIIIKPSLLSRYLPNSSFQVDINCIVDLYNKLGLGVSYRTQDAIVGMIQFHINNQMILGYSYDHTISDLQQYNNGSHELFLRYDFLYKIKAIDPRFF